jgi:hypothetical protein
MGGFLFLINAQKSGNSLGKCRVIWKPRFTSFREDVRAGKLYTDSLFCNDYIDVKDLNVVENEIWDTVYERDKTCKFPSARNSSGSMESFMYFLNTFPLLARASESFLFINRNWDKCAEKVDKSLQNTNTRREGLRICLAFCIHQTTMNMVALPIMPDIRHNMDGLSIAECHELLHYWVIECQRNFDNCYSGKTNIWQYIRRSEPIIVMQILV